jgi:hypothetical protein
VAASAEELLKEWEEEDRELKELRRRSADWRYIESLATASEGGSRAVHRNRGHLAGR